ncbi:MAG TPA: NfeD family protein [Geobacterales bacterium]|nr:NfeD family protein [Geobacterales bacterium]
MNKIAALLASLADDFLIIIVILAILPLLGIYLPIWFIATIIAILLIISLFVYRALSSMKRPIAVGKEVIIGKIGETMTDLEPEGLVYLENEIWTAISKRGKIEKGKKVKVTELYGTKLIVEEV